MKKIKKSLKMIGSFDQKRQRRIELILMIVAVAAVIVVFISLWQLWIGITSRMSLSGDCEIKSVRYVALQGNGSCMFPLVQGDISYCALPQDVHCSGVAADAPVFRFLYEGLKRK